SASPTWTRASSPMRRNAADVVAEGDVPERRAFLDDVAGADVDPGIADLHALQGFRTPVFRVALQPALDEEFDPVRVLVPQLDAGLGGAQEEALALVQVEGEEVGAGAPTHVG